MARMRRRRAVVFGLTLAVPLIVAVMGWVTVREARGAASDQVETTEQMLAATSAHGVSSAVSAAQEHIAALSRSSVVVDAARAGRLDLLHDQLAVFQATSGTTGVVATLVDGGEARVGDAPAAGPGTTPVFHPVGDRTSAGLTLRDPVIADGRTVAVLAVELDLGSLSPQLSQPFEGYGGRTSLIRRDGSILMSSTAPPGTRVEAQPLLDLLRRGQAGIVTYDAPQLGSRRIAAVAPVSGTDLMVVVGADAAAARAPIAGLVRRLVLLVVLTMLVVLLLLVLAVATVRGGRHELESSQQRAIDLAHTDPLTGLANRRAFDRALEDSRGPVAVVMADIDLLKAINDELGHAAGDEALRATAQAITSAIRPGDLAARVGGDEFAVLLPGTSSSVALEVGERIRHAVRQVGDPSGRPLSASIGVAAGVASESAQLLLGADAALYSAKASREG
jgi:diguanylate cyclase (GGDEF)-like protein